MNTPLQLWKSDTTFLHAFNKIANLTLVDPWRCHILYQHVQASSSIPGDIAEVGVYKGGTARLLVDAGGDRAISFHLFDTFTGIPGTADPLRDLHKVGDFSDTTLAQVSALFEKDARVHIYPGMFPHSAAHRELDLSSYSVVHIDVDIYRSVIDCAAWFYPKLSKGGVMIFDDYGFPSCPGAKMGVDDFFRHAPDRPIYLPTGQCIVRKL